MSDPAAGFPAPDAARPSPAPSPAARPSPNIWEHPDLYELENHGVDPDGVRDKDGITAALLIAEQAATLRTHGRTLSDVLDDLARTYGVYLTDAFSVRVEDLSLIERVMSRLREDPATDIGGITVERLDDLARGDGGLPPTDGLRYLLADRTRVIVRPSGTEPKVKIYCEVIEPVTDDLASARSRAGARMSAVRATMETLTSLEDEPVDTQVEDSVVTAETTEGGTRP